MGRGFAQPQSGSARSVSRRTDAGFARRNRTLSGSGMRHRTLNCIALHKIDMIGVFTLRARRSGIPML
jgi:hypothetical protein